MAKQGRQRSRTKRRRTLFFRLLMVMLAVLSTYAAMTVLLGYQLGATILSDVFQRELVGPQLTALEDGASILLSRGRPTEVLQSYLDQRYAEAPRMSVAIYDEDGVLLASRAGSPGPPPDRMGPQAMDRLATADRYQAKSGFGFIAAGAVRGWDPPRLGEGPTIGYVRLAAKPSTTPTRRLIAEVSWRWGFPIFLLSVLAAFLGTHSITARLRAAESAVRRLAAGDSAARIPVGNEAEATDELGRVATAFNRTADLLQHSIEELEQTMATRRRLLADLAHEMNTPLTNVCAYLESLLMAEEEGGMDEPTRLNFLQVAMEEAERLRHLSRDLDTIIKLEERELVMERDLVDVSELAASLAERIRPKASQKGLEVLTHIEPNAKIVGDRMRLEQVGMNLLENCLRYTNEGSIRVEVSANEGGVTWVVKDTGIGIPAADIERVMDRFYRVDGSRTRATGGSGLGLSIVSGIVERHGGQVLIQSEEGAWTRVEVWFPREGTLADVPAPI